MSATPRGPRSFVVRRIHRDSYIRTTCAPSVPHIPLGAFSPSLSIFITTTAEVRSHPYQDTFRPLHLVAPSLSATRASARGPEAASVRAVQWSRESIPIRYHRRSAERRASRSAPCALCARLSVIGNKFRNKLPVTPATHRGKANGAREEAQGGCCSTVSSRRREERRGSSERAAKQTTIIII